jgi:hypothetical protein
VIEVVHRGFVALAALTKHGRELKVAIVRSLDMYQRTMQEQQQSADAAGGGKGKTKSNLSLGHQLLHAPGR